MEFSIKVDVCTDKVESGQKRVMTPSTWTRSPRKVIRLHNNSLNRAISTSPFQEFPATQSTPDIVAQYYNDKLQLQKKFEEPGLSIFYLNNLKFKEKVPRRTESVVYPHIYQEDPHIQGAIDYYKQRLEKKTEKKEKKFDSKIEENILKRINRQRIRKKFFKKSENLAESLKIKDPVRFVKTPQIVFKKMKELIPLTKAKVIVNREKRPSSKEIKETLRNFRIQFVGK